MTTSEEPPASRFARVGGGELVEPGDLDFPSVPQVTAPSSAHVAYRVDYGPRFRDQGIIDRQPPSIGAVFPTLVPQVAADGNEIGGLRMPEIAVPVASYTPWNYRSEETGSPGELADFRGSFFPFPATDDERSAIGDPRPSLEALYGSRAEYLVRYTDAALELVEEGFLLTEDLPEIIEHGKRLWDLVAAR